MGVNKEQAVARREGPKQKGAAVDWDAIPHVGEGGGVKWADVDPSALIAVADVATRNGMAISLSATSNGKAVSITLLDGGHRPKWYANSVEELDRLLAWLADVIAHKA